MDSEEKELLSKIYALARENNEMLRSLRRSIRVGQIFRFLYWVLVIAGTVGAFVYIQPLLSNLLGTYQQALDGIGQIGQSAVNLDQIQSEAGSFRGQFQELLKTNNK